MHTHSHTHTHTHFNYNLNTDTPPVLLPPKAHSEPSGPARKAKPPKEGGSEGASSVHSPAAGLKAQRSLRPPMARGGSSGFGRLRVY